MPIIPPPEPPPGTPGDDVIWGTPGKDIINALEGNDRIIANNGKDVVDCGAGNDIANGGGGDDVLYGGEGHDRLFGGGGDDIINGGDGNDVLYGGKPEDKTDTNNNGSDQFWFDADDGSDKVFGFTTAAVKPNGTSDQVHLTEGGTYTLEYNGVSTFLHYGSTTVVFYNAILSSADIVGADLVI